MQNQMLMGLRNPFQYFISFFFLHIFFFFVIGTAQAQKSFSFLAFGDMPYHLPQDLEWFERLTKAVNAHKPLFSVHVGDIKNGQSDCSDAYYSMIKNLFMQFNGPLIYTPGDNEWTDCNRPLSGSYDPVERLQKVRSVFYDGKQSMGKKPIRTFNQSNLSRFEKFIENQYWEHGSVGFGTIHAVGTNNNLVADQDITQEFYERDEANLNWLDYIFDEAEKSNQKGIVLFTQAAMNFVATPASGHYNIVQKLRVRVEKFKRPVLLVYGDHHRFLVEKPLFSENGKLLKNFTSVMVFGESEMHAVKIDVDPKKEHLFKFSEFWIEGN